MEATDNKDAEMKPEEHEEAKEVKEGEQTTDQPQPDAEHVDEPVPKGKPISHLVDQAMAAMIQDMGFTKEVAEKSLLYTNNKSVEIAMDWIQQHQEDEDFLEEELIADESQFDPNKPKLTKEEKVAAAIELQKRLRAKRIAEDKKIAEEQEKERIRSTKDLQIAKRKMEEQQMNLRRELDRKEKMEFLKEKKRMEELLRKVSTKIWLILILKILGTMRKSRKAIYSR